MARWSEAEYAAYQRNRGVASAPASTTAVARPPSARRFSIILPEPPSVNNMYSNTPNGRVLTQEARDWKNAAITLTRMSARDHQWYYTAGQRIRIRIVTHFSEERDITNAVKITEDAVAKGCGFNDRVVDHASVRRGDDRPNSRAVEVRVWFCN